MTIFNVKDNHGGAGDQGDGSNNDAPAIQRAITAAETDPAGGGVVFFPPGNYRIESTIHLKSNLSVRGSGTENTRIFRDPPTSRFSIVFVVQHVEDGPLAEGPHANITIQDMTLDGGQTVRPALPVDQSHGIDIRSAQRVFVSNCRIINCGGDGIKINYGDSEVPPPSAEINIEKCSFDTIWRIGITISHLYRDIIIQSCIFQNWENFAIKAEIESTTTPNDESLDRGLTITRCTCLPPTIEGPANAGSISIYSPAPQPFRDVTISHNMLRGTARFRGMHHTVFEGNTVLHTGSAEDAALDLWGNVVDFAARHNTLRVERGLGFRAWSGESDRYPDVDPNKDLVFSYNTVEWISSSPPVYNPPPMTPPLFEGRAVALHSAQDAVVEGNILRGAKPGATAWPVELPALQVALRNPAHTQGGQPPPPQRITLTHNIVEGYPIGIQLHDPATTLEQTLTDLVVAHNVLDRCVKGIELNRAERLERLVLSGHVVVQPPTGSASLVWNGTSLPPYLIGGVHGQDALAVGFFVGQGAPGSSPEPRVQSAAVGSLYLDSTPSGGRLWVRQKSGGTPQWTAL